jgi:hypothetical protein
VLWLLKHNPDLRIAIVSFESEAAVRWGRHVRDDIEANNLGIRVREDVKAAGRWQIVGHRGSVYCTGWQGSLTGQPVDMLIIDDPVKGTKEVDSPTYRQDQWDWWIATARARLGPNSRVLCIMTRWHPDDLGGRFLANEPDRWTVDSSDDPGASRGAGRPDRPGSPASGCRPRVAAPRPVGAAANRNAGPVVVRAVPGPADAAGRRGVAGSVDRRRSTRPARPVTRPAETGIIVVALGIDGHVYVFDDRSLRAPAATAR